MSERMPPRTHSETQIADFLQCPVPGFMLDCGVHRRPISKDFRRQMSYHLKTRHTAHLDL